MMMGALVAPPCLGATQGMNIWHLFVELSPPSVPSRPSRKLWTRWVRRLAWTMTFFLLKLRTTFTTSQEQSLMLFSSYAS